VLVVSAGTATRSWQDADMASRFRFVLAQFGVKRGAAAQLQQLLDADDLPGTGWRRRDQRSWRTGAVAEPQPWQATASAAGLVTVWRSFSAGPRWLWLQYAPLITSADADQAMTHAAQPEAGLRNLRAKVQATARRDLDPPPAVNGARLVSATEDDTTGSSPVLTLRCVAGVFVLVICASGPGWSWPEVVAVAERQLTRLGQG
jgi:hypothetical protein